MNLIDKYVAEVGKHLPLLKGREDIEKELKSTLEDMLEDRAEQAGRPRDEALELELLKEYGSPQKVASTYNPHPFLIGPRLFPFFLMVLKIVITVVVTVLLGLAGIRAVTATPMMGAEFIRVIGQGFSEALSAAVAAFGNVVLVFAILERVLPEKEIGDFSDEKDWDPASLAKEPDPAAIKRFDLVAEIVFTFIGLAILNGIFYIPIFSAEFARFVPWINATFLAKMLLDVYLLRTAQWTLPTRILEVIIDGASLAISIVIVRTPNLFIFTPGVFTNIPTNAADLQTLAGIFDLSVSIALIVVVIVQGIDLIKSLYGLLKVNYQTK